MTSYTEACALYAPVAFSNCTFEDTSSAVNSELEIARLPAVIRLLDNPNTSPYGTNGTGLFVHGTDEQSVYLDHNAVVYSDNDSLDVWKSQQPAFTAPLSSVSASHFISDTDPWLIAAQQVRGTTIVRNCKQAEQ
jgi:hypothetical protein